MTEHEAWKPEVLLCPKAELPNLVNFVPGRCLSSVTLWDTSGEQGVL